MTSFEVEIDDEAVQRLFAKVQGRISQAGLRVFLRGTTHNYLAQRIAQRFSGEGDDASGKWADLKDATAAIRSYQGYGAYGPINVRTGALERFVSTSFRLTAAGAGGMTLSIPGTSRSRELQSKLKVAQTGGYATAKASRARAAGPNRPAVPRPVLALSGFDQQTISTSLMDWINGAGR